MPCKLCTQTFELEKRSGNIYWISSVDELNRKIIKEFNQIGYEVETKQGLAFVHVDSIYNFFHTNIKWICDTFHLLERETLKIFIEDENHPFDLQALMASRPLQQYVNLIEDKSFFDIVNNESITSYFQPIIQADNNSIFGYEMLARGVNEDGSLMSPGELFEKSARNDFNFKLDRMCRESALKTAATKKVHQKIFINFIPTSIYDPKFCLQSTVKWAKQLEFDPKNIVFEVVETEKVADQGHLKKILTYYRDQGFQIALDDVGEGYSSLNMLVDLKPDIIKVDRNIIQNIHEDSFKKSIYQALYTVAKENSVSILAEGVETKEELEAINSIGADYYQGYYFAKPGAEPVRKI